MKKLKDYSNEEIGMMVLLELKEDAERILKEAFPDSTLHYIHMFSNNDCEIKIDDRLIKIRRSDGIT